MKISKNRKFETILSRGVAKVDQMINYTIKLADKDCVWVLYKGEQVKEELFAAKVSLINKKAGVYKCQIRYADSEDLYYH